MHGRTLAGLLWLLVVVLAGCGGGDDPSPAADKDGRQELLERIDTRPRDVEGEDDQIKRLLADRSRALERRDADMLAATAAGAQRQRDERALANLEQLPLEQVRLSPDEVQISGDKATVLVPMSYRVKGASRPFITVRKVSAQRTEDGWKVTGDVPRREPLPWEVERFRATTGAHVVLLTPPGIDPEPLLPGLEEAYDETSRDLPARDLPERVLVIAARDARQVKRLDGTGIGTGIVAMASVRVEYEAGEALEVGRVLGQRMTLVMDRFDAMPPEERQLTMTHEMVHTAMNPDTSGRTPVWLMEGVAMYVSNEDLSHIAPAIQASGERPTLTALSRHDGMDGLDADAQSAAYVVASAAAQAIVEEHGAKGLFAFYEAFNDSSIGGAPGTRTTDRVLRKTLGMSLRELDAQVAAG